MNNDTPAGYDCWLAYTRLDQSPCISEYEKICSNVVTAERDSAILSAVEELKTGIKKLLGIKISVTVKPRKTEFLVLGTPGSSQSIDAFINKEEKTKIAENGFLVRHVEKAGKRFVIIAGCTGREVLYGAFYFLKSLRLGKNIRSIDSISNPAHPLRMIDHWDNLDGSIERGYAGRSVFFKDNKLTNDFRRIKDYARILASVGINAVVLNNVNVRDKAVWLITKKYLPGLRAYARIFRAYGIKIFLCVNYASPMIIDKLPSADPLDGTVRAWWKNKVKEIYRNISDFGGFLVKADSEHTPGPFTYGRNHEEGANMLAEALEPFGGILAWRCFVYNCTQDWRDRTVDRARAAFDIFKPLDGGFKPNVFLQIKNGPVDFQVREPVSPLFGGLEKTNRIIELQVTQEYTGQQKHLCYLVPIWKEVFEFDTYAQGEGSQVKKITTGKVFPGVSGGIAGVSNIGDDSNWTGHDLAQANLYGFGRLAWNPDLAPDEIAEEWARLAFANDPLVVKTVKEMLLDSAGIYESYTAPLGIGWMVNPGYHYGPNVDGYEYSKWGTYHRADHAGIGIDRSVKSGTGYAGLYHAANARMYETIGTCPEELLLFFHHVPYVRRLRSGKTVIQHIYDTHFQGVERVSDLMDKWKSLESRIKDGRFEAVLKRFEEQLSNSKEWRDVINTYFYRKSGIPDELGRKIY